MRRNPTVAGGWALLSILLLSHCSSVPNRADPERRAGRRLVMISIDGLRPEFYLDQRYPAPHLRRVKETGAWSAGVEPIFPSVTYPSHASLVTGVSSAEHGVLANKRFADGPSEEWYWDEKHLKASTLWHVTRAAGGRVAILRWPASVGSAVDWLLPEIFFSPGIDPVRDWALVASRTDPGFLAELKRATGVDGFRNVDEVDQFSTEAAVYVLREKKPDLTLVHLISVDIAQHLAGREAESVRQALATTDARVGRILAATDPERDVVFIVGDHGFSDFRRLFHPNAWLATKGWLQGPGQGSNLARWDAYVQADGGSGAVYVRDPKQAERVVRELKAAAHGRFRVLDRSELDKLGAFPGAVAALEAAAGWALGGRYSGNEEEVLPAVRGHHGYLPTLKAMRTGFIAAGPGVQRGELPKFNLLQVAPTAAAVLNVSLPAARGQVLLPVVGAQPSAVAH
jgi:predicted AlkP superfamily pyrophosphatase or phosphodiesterase